VIVAIPPAAAFTDAASARRHVAAELDRAVTAGWSWRRGDDDALSWRIDKQVVAGEWPEQDFRLFLSADLQFLVITHDNRDVGMMTAARCLQNAFLVHTPWLPIYPLSDLLGRVLAEARPNQWGYS
jgi:hypothetical protein